MAVILLLLALGAVWYYFKQAPEEQITTGATQSAPAAQTPIREPETEALPPLGEADAFVRELVRALSQHPIVASLLTTDQLIRTFAVSVHDIAAGNTPSRHLFTIKPQDQFQVRKADGATYIDPRSYARFAPHAAAIDGLDPAGAARVYERLKPRIEEAYREVAGADADLDRALARAIAHLLETPIVERDIAVEQAVVGYTYADPSLEGLSRAQQQLLRMGPKNARMVQDKLRAIARELGIE